MTLLDRFRAASPDKHPDVNVRLAFVASLPIADRDTIAAMAREDEDPRVRRAAAAKLMDAAGLAAIARNDRDDTVRAQANDMLRDIALEAFEGVGEAEALDAVDALDDVRSLVAVAKTAGREIVALRALSRITDSRSWGSIARHSSSEAVRRGALDLLRDRSDQTELLAVAMNGEFKDTAIAAVDLLSGTPQLVEQIAARGKNKAAVKRARSIVRDAAAATAPESVLESASPDAGESPVPSPEVTAPSSLTDAAPAAPEPSQTAAEQDRQRAEAEAAAREAQERERFESEQMAAAREAERQRDAERKIARQQELTANAESAAAEADLTTARRLLNQTHREWMAEFGAAPDDSELAARLQAAEARLAAREREVREVDQRARQEALSHLVHLVGRVESLSTRPDVSLKAAERAARDLRTAMASLPPLPTKQDAEEISKRLKAAHVALTPRLQELRDADDWQRWANAGVQEELCAKMEALQALSDPEEIARSVRELQERWRKAADVPRAQADALWRRFKAAHDVVWPRCEAHFAAEAQARAENLAKRVALCEKAEALAESSDWIRTAEEIKAFQAEWKTIGPVPRGREKAVWERFRTACDRFFTRRHDDLAQRKVVWAENLAKKTALCEKAEALAGSTDWEPAAAEIKRLQTEWKAIGAVKKSRSEAVWRRFRAACDLFFTRYAQRHDLTRAERVAAREAICAELEALTEESSSADSAAPSDLLGKVRALRSRWQQELAARGVDPDQARALEQRFSAAHARVLSMYPQAFSGTELDVEGSRKRMELLVARVEDLASSIAGPATDGLEASVSPATRLASMLKEALAANTIGGKAQDNSRLTAAAEEVRHAQASWSKIGPVPEEVRKPLYERFQRATRSVLDRAGGGRSDHTGAQRGASPRSGSGAGRREKRAES